MNHTKPNVLEADSVVVNFDDRQVLRSIYLRCEQGEIVGLLGRNGCGKSTLLKVIFGLLQPESKSLRINNEWIAAGYMDSRVMLLPQEPMIPSNISVQAAIKLFGITAALPEMDHLLSNKVTELSGGELRFFELLLVLYSKSWFCLLDEPFSGLSPVMVEKAISIMQEVKKQKGIVITDHMHRYVTSCSNRLYLMTDGRMRKIDHPGQLVEYGYLGMT